MSDLITAELFSPHVGQLFQVGDTELSLVLVSVDVGKPFPGSDRIPFSMIFRGPKQPWAPENLWVMRAPDGVAHEIYIAPIHTPNPAAQDYQAIFN